MIVCKFIKLPELQIYFLDHCSLLFEAFHIARIEMEMDCGPEDVVVVGQAVFGVGDFVCAKEAVLRVEEEVVREVVDLVKVDFDASKSIIAYIMVTDSKDNRHHAIQLTIEFVKDIIEIIPAIETSPHPIIIRIITSNDKHMRVIAHKMRGERTGIPIEPDIAAHSKTNLIGVLARQSTVVCAVEDGLGCGVFCEDGV